MGVLNKKKKKQSYKKFLPFLLFIAVLFMTVGYATINSITMAISGNVSIDVQQDVYISEIDTNAETETSQIISAYKTLLKTKITLSPENKDSQLSYTITIRNNTQDDYGFEGIKYMDENNTYDNQNITYDLSNITIGERLKSKSSKTFTITFHYKDNVLADNNVLNSYLNISFKKIYSVDYVNIAHNSLPTEVLDTQTFNYEFVDNIPQDLDVYIDDEQVTDYSYTNDTLTIPNVTGNLKIVGFQEPPNLLNNNLTPVYYDGEYWRVSSSVEGTYDYAKQEWANAVLLKSDVSLTEDEVVDISNDVRGMFVWIPRYEYKISTDDSKEIFINFISKETTTSRDGYTIHPAFKFGTTEVSGIWVGKFETSTDQTNSCSSSSTMSACNTTDLDIFVLPNVTSLREQTINTQFNLSLNFKQYFSNESTNANSHMMKNSEWASVSYLTQSAYGKYGNPNYSAANKEVYVNNSSDLYTGKSSGKPEYLSDSESLFNYDYGFDNGILINEENGVGASTTGNITGIYDMNGGSYEYVMGYLSTASQTLGVWGATSIYDYAEFSSTPDSKYYDDYTSSTLAYACSNGSCDGHALGETSGWYNDSASFLTTDNPWVMRGGVFDSNESGGIFAYTGTIGYAGSYATFRISMLEE